MRFRELFSPIVALTIFSAAVTFAACPETTPGPTDTDQGVDASVDADTDQADVPPPVVNLVINEIVASRADGGEDWIELYASGSEPVQLSEYSVRDSSHGATQLLDKTLQPGEFYVVYATGSSGSKDGTPWVPFKLGSSDSVTLSLDGTDVHKLQWLDGDAAQGTAYGLAVDGDTTVVDVLEPTPGAANKLLDGPPPPKLDLFQDNVVIPMELTLSAADWTTLKAQPLVEDWYIADLKMEGHTIADVGIRTKGVSDLRVVHGDQTIRFSFRVDVNRNVAGQRVDGRRGFILNNAYMDPTFMREALGYELYRRAGVEMPKTQYVDLTVGGEHLGLYLLVELVDKEWIQANFSEFQDGDLYEPEPPAGTLQHTGGDYTTYAGMGLETNEGSSHGETFVELVNALAADTFDSRIDVTSTIAYLAVSVLTSNLDSYLGEGTNYYLYDANSRFFIAPWDTDQGFGTYDCGCGAAAMLTIPIDTPTCAPVTERPLVSAFLARPEYMAKYEQKLASLTAADTGDGTLGVLGAQIEQWRTLLKPYVEANPTKLFTAAQFEDSVDTTIVQSVVAVGGADRTIPGLKPFITARVESVKAQLAGTEARTGPSDSICGVP